MSLAADLKTIYSLAVASSHGATHAERLESFYSAQAAGYDDFRRRLLQGREELFRMLPAPERGSWLDMGGGTGGNLEFLGDRLARLAHVSVVDLAPSLLTVARRRIAERGWTNVEAVEADVTTLAPSRGPADVVTFSYSLTMIPDWFAAIDRAYELLKPGGTIGVVDFYVSRKHAAAERTRHPWSTRTFWPAWFGHDNVHPSPDHLPYLARRFEPLVVQERRAKVPYLPFVRAPYYIFLGRRA